ncbi:Brefeldin A-inhibited guanine nucleotide-exchange protein 1 [Sesamum angolense]|uniref:Brefeldin A-inhibited guanine nucleotide-exchange protein 1 n=1 Tax=Sesamum angolense TaxID=2727404 RepID=A0AAE2C1B1_9LAMI|nr:Brefeldin A-inhibited guanine nucleotide-exchange protein 1 [Sesamum angolense]
MSVSQTLGGASRCGWVLGPSLDKIIKNVAWRKHSHLVSVCKSTLDKFESLVDASDPTSCSPLYGLSSSDGELLLQPLIMAVASGSPKVLEPALDCAFRLFSFGLIRGCEIKDNSSIIFRLIDSVCKCAALGDDAIELAVLKVVLSAVRSPCIYISGDCLVYIVKSCYNIYLGGHSGTVQICAKSVLAQMMIIVFTRVEQNSMLVDFKNVSVSELLEFADRNLNEGSSIHFAQNFINEIVESKDSPPDVKLSLDLQNGCNCLEEKADEGHGKSVDEAADLSGFLSAVKQYLCLSLLKNSGLSVMTVFQLLCAILWNLLSKFRSGLKSEIGIFFPMLILRVLENVLQPSFLQKMTVLSLLEKISHDSQIVVDTFVNYDCDVEAPNIFERTVNGLLKTALGPPPGSITSLSPAQDMTFRHESVKCLVRIIKSMGSWMDQQLKVGELSPSKFSDNENLTETPSYPIDDTNIVDYELHSEANSEFSNAASLEQRRAYKLEIQKGVALFNRKPSKGIEFLISAKKVGSSPEEVASFLKSTRGLNESMIGDYFGEREEFPMKVMHAYVDSFNFEKMGFGEAIRFFLRGFRLPGEAQKIDRIMEKFAERYCKCNPNSFTSADTAYVLAYSVIMLNTDAHNSMVKDKIFIHLVALSTGYFLTDIGIGFDSKMTKADFIRNNRGIDDGKDLPEDYLGALYDQIVKNEIKMNAELSAPQSKQGNSLNKLLGFDGILNLWKAVFPSSKCHNCHVMMIVSRVVYYAVADPTILRFMVEVCWGPMIAAFSVTLDQSDDKEATAQCLQGFRHAVHVTAMMGSMGTYFDMLIPIRTSAALGGGAPSDASFLNAPTSESEEITLRNASYPALKKKGTLQNPAVMAVVRGSSYDSTSVGVNSPGLVTPEQINNFISNLHLLDQIGNFELNHIFAHSQRLNSEAIVAFVKALCKVSMSELQSPTDPRVFSLTKIVEVAHYNMNRIRLVWSRIWSVLSEFFVAVGLSENLSVAIFVMDSLRQLAMKFLEREELVLGLFDCSDTSDLELLWKFIVQALVSCQCGYDGLACNEKSKGDDSCSQVVKDNALDGQMYIDKDDQMCFWVPLLSGLSKLTWDPRSAIRKSALEVLFNILKDHGHLFPQPFWAYVFNCAIFPIFTVDSKEARKEDSGSLNSGPMHPDGSVWDSVTSVVAAECLIDLFIHFFDFIRAQLHGVVSILVEFVISPGQGPSSAGVAALMRLAADLRGKLLEDEWLDIFLCLKEAAGSNLSGFAKLLKTMDDIEMPHVARPDDDIESTSGRGLTDDGSEDDNLQTVAYVVSRMKVHIAVQLLIIQVATDLYKMHQQSLPVNIVTILLEIYSLTASHSNKLNSQTTLLHKLEKICSTLEISDPPLVHFENESYRNYLNFLHDLLMNSPTMSEEKNVEAELVSVCEKVLRIYLECSGHGYASQKAIRKSRIHCYLPLGSAKKEELAARTPLVLTVMQTLGSLGRDIFRRRVLQLFPLFVDLVRSEHSSPEVQLVLSTYFNHV